MMIKVRFCRKLVSSVLIGLLLCGLSGCMLLPQEKEDREVSFSKVDGPPKYTLISPQRMDMEKSIDIPCVYRQKKDVPLSFKLANRVVDKVNVENGDKVKKGMLLASLQMNDLEEEISSLEKEIELMKKSIDLVKVKASYDKQFAELDYKYKNVTKMELNQTLRMIADNMKTEVEAKEDEIYLQNLVLKKKKKLVADGKIYAPMDGIINYLQGNLKGRISEDGLAVISMVDSAECSFEINVSEDTVHLKTGQTYTVDCKGASYEGTIKPQAGDNKNFLYLQLKKPPTNLTIGQNGIIHLQTETKMNALVLPVINVHEGDGYHFVYVINKNNVKCIQKVELGFRSLDYVEIISGLTDNDQIVSE